MTSRRDCLKLSLGAGLALALPQASLLAVHPNDHVNLGQSSNDVVPTAIRVMAVLENGGMARAVEVSPEERPLMQGFNLLTDKPVLYYPLDSWFIRSTAAKQRLQELNTTIIYVTHDQVEAMTLGQRIVVLKDGEIQQIDTPMALYEKPANLFVAGFLGSPAMNVLYGTLPQDEGLHFALDGGGQIPLGTAAVAEAWVGRRIALGIRPEHLQPAGIGKTAFEAHVDLIEPVGNEVFVNLRFVGQSLVARMPPLPWAVRWL